jgi:EmrB/QacA subfamily drug resistance transporter
MSGLMLGQFSTMLASTVIAAGLPAMARDLDGNQASTGWIVTATLLAVTVATPIWGKLADHYDRKRLVQIGLAVYLAASLLSGLAQSMPWLLTTRVVQGVGVAAQAALIQAILADLVSARERGRYAGYQAMVLGAATVSGPLIGGVLTDAFSWRWCFFVSLPLGTGALAMMQATLHLPARPKRPMPRIDWLGAALIGAATMTLLIWITNAGRVFDWLGAESIGLVAVGAALLAAAVAVERRAADPVVPPRLFNDRTTMIAIIGAVAVGTALFGATVMLSQYLQFGRGRSATASGLLIIPMMVGMVIASTLGGHRVVRTGRYRRLMTAGGLVWAAGFGLMGLADTQTSLTELGTFAFLIGVGVGLLTQNVVVVVQNCVSVEDVGAASALVSFFVTLGGAAGVAVMGALLSARTTGGYPATAASPEFAHAVGDVFLLISPFGLLVAAAMFFLPERELRMTVEA